MDALSHLLSLARPRVRVDERCLLAGSFTLVNEAPPPGEAMFHLLLAGQCRMQTDTGTVLDLRAGDFVLLPRGDPHTLRDRPPAGRPPTVPAWQPRPASGPPLKCDTSTPSADDVDLLCGHFSYRQGAGSLLVRMLPPVLRVCLHDIDSLHGLVALLRSEVVRPSPGGLAVIDALGQTLFSLALRTWSTDGRTPAGVLALATDARLGPSIQAMMRTPGAPWTIESLGALVGMSRATYARHFQRLAGIGVAELLQSIRLMHACELLRHTRRSLGDIAQAVGYRSEASFGKAFRQSLGQAPGKWRRADGIRHD
ncbi:AraC family transcriptional regulator [Lysobacter pythonis]|uniref:AraC family transcriptional regulator n=1 Tax=Solilutibacter pythonis TaxID=2483112 RepID=A0A3M2HYZ2_9GAMM|nr:AraC family transcriptional regulator [Lysobacter pythonis]RMH92870.1 AraC family transcriptional regulator [Lysobacter pythonis]